MLGTHEDPMGILGISVVVMALPVEVDDALLLVFVVSSKVVVVLIMFPSHSGVVTVTPPTLMVFPMLGASVLRTSLMSGVEGRVMSGRVTFFKMLVMFLARSVMFLAASGNLARPCPSITSM